MSDPIKCPNPQCHDKGWWAEWFDPGEAEQIQCQFCYEEQNSVFNRRQLVKRLIGAENADKALSNTST